MNNKHAEILHSLLRSIARTDDEFQRQLRACVGVSKRAFDSFLDKAEFVSVAKDQTLNTVNVVEMNNGEFQMVRSFPETEEGNKAAEAFFRRKLEAHEKENKLQPSDEEDFQAYIEDGLYEDCGGWQLFLTHSV